jgi:endonuclease YncB( thermonuclease family)
VLLAGPGWARAAATRSLIAEVTHVADGTTITVVDTVHATHRIRLLGIEVPGPPPRRRAEHSLAEEARQFLDQLLARKFVRAEVYGADRQRALLGVVFDGPFNVNLLLVSMGYARVPRNANCESYCRALRDAEAKAVREKVGMWQQPSGVRSRTPAHGS